MLVVRWFAVVGGEMVYSCWWFAVAAGEVVYSC